MNRSGYSESIDLWALIRYRGAVASAIRGRRGQAFLRELANLLDAMPNKRLHFNDLEHPLGADAPVAQFCTLGVITNARGHDTLSPEVADLSTNPDELAELLGIAPVLVKEIVWENDAYGSGPQGQKQAEGRWRYMRKWVDGHLRKYKAAWLPPEAIEGIYEDTVCKLPFYLWDSLDECDFSELIFNQWDFF